MCLLYFKYSLLNATTEVRVETEQFKFGIWVEDRRKEEGGGRGEEEEEGGERK